MSILDFDYIFHPPGLSSLPQVTQKSIYRLKKNQQSITIILLLGSSFSSSLKPTQCIINPIISLHNHKPLLRQCLAWLTCRGIHTSSLGSSQDLEHQKWAVVSCSPHYIVRKIEGGLRGACGIKQTNNNKNWIRVSGAGPTPATLPGYLLLSCAPSTLSAQHP